MEDDGFISMYALLLLSIFLAFALMFAQSIHTFIQTHTPRPTQYIDIHIIKEIQQELKNQTAEAEKEKTEDSKQDAVNEAKKTIFSVYKTNTIQYIYEASQVHVSYQLHGIPHVILVTYHRDHKSIMNYAYQ